MAVNVSASLRAKGMTSVLQSCWEKGEREGWKEGREMVEEKKKKRAALAEKDVSPASTLERLPGKSSARVYHLLLNGLESRPRHY